MLNPLISPTMNMRNEILVILIISLKSIVPRIVRPYFNERYICARESTFFRKLFARVRRRLILSLIIR